MPSSVEQERKVVISLSLTATNSQRWYGEGYSKKMFLCKDKGSYTSLLSTEAVENWW